MEQKTAKTYNIGNSDYSKHTIQPYDIWKEYGLNAWEADIIKRILRKKGNDKADEYLNKRLDIEKIRHICTYLLENFSEIYGTTGI